MSYRISKLLTTNNAKTIKGEKLGYITYILYMTSFTDNSKGINLCSHASEGCAKSCLVGSGFGGMYQSVYEGRKNKTEYFLSDRAKFMLQLDEEITKAVKKHEGKEIVTIRLNGTTDIRFEKFKVRDNKNIFELHPNVQFYDYTKNYLRFDNPLPKNYHLTFSRSEKNGDKAMEMLQKGHNVAMVFDVVPETYMGYKVINGDKDDLRFKDDKNVIVGLRYKKMTGKGGAELNAEALSNGFVIITKVKSLPKGLNMPNKAQLKRAA